MPITMHRRDTSWTVAEPLGMLEAGRKKTRYFSYPPAQADKPDATAEQIAAIVTERCNSYLLRISGR